MCFVQPLKKKKKLKTRKDRDRVRQVRSEEPRKPNVGIQTVCTNHDLYVSPNSSYYLWLICDAFRDIIWTSWWNYCTLPCVTVVLNCSRLVDVGAWAIVEAFLANTEDSFLFVLYCAIHLYVKCQPKCQYCYSRVKASFTSNGENVLCICQ